MGATIDWAKEVKPLLKKYKGKHHPLNYNTIYELMVMTILAARDSDRRINDRAPKLFEAFPNMKSLSQGNEEDIKALIAGIVNFRNKTKWLMSLAQTVKDDKNIPSTLDELTELPGIGRKTANVIMHEAGVKAEGVIVDLHVVRVAPRLGIAKGTNAEKIEKQIMDIITSERMGRYRNGYFVFRQGNLSTAKT